MPGRRLPEPGDSGSARRLPAVPQLRVHQRDQPAHQVRDLLGGHHRSRLTREFRNDRGWNCSPWALLRAGRDHGLWQVSVRVPERHVAETVDRVRGLVGDDAQDPAEHGAAVAHAATEIRGLWSSGESAASLLGYWQDLGLDVAAEKDRWLSALAATTPEDVVAAAGRWLAGEPGLEIILA